jgi:hypothetical protein
MNTLSPGKVGLAFALFLGLWHACWAILVAVGFAQPLMDFILRMHFIKPIFVIEAFEPLRALGLIGITTLPIKMQAINDTLQNSYVDDIVNEFIGRLENDFGVNVNPAALNQATGGGAQQ